MDVKHKHDIKKHLTKTQEAVMLRKGTEPKNRNFPEGFDDHFESGSYLCACCHSVGERSVLYTSDMKLHCKTGWPSFGTNVRHSVALGGRQAHGGEELVCSRCEVHLGDVFTRGEEWRMAGGADAKERHCINSVCLVFEPAGAAEVIKATYAGKINVHHTPPLSSPSLFEEAKREFEERLRRRQAAAGGA